MQSSSISITFGKEREDGNGNGDDDRIALSLELDSVANGGKTSFVVNQNVYLKFLFPGSSPYTVKSSMGTAGVAATNIHYLVQDEEVQFANSKTGALRYYPFEGVTHRWIGISAGTPHFNGKEITLGGLSVAILNCTYKTKGDRLFIVSSKVGNVLVVAIQGKNQASLTVNFGGKDGEEPPPPPVPYELEVKDYCTDEILPGVTIYLDDADIGQTDANGIIALGALVPGSTHSLRMAKGGYINSEKDKLDNDSFTIPE